MKKALFHPTAFASARFLILSLAIVCALVMPGSLRAQSLISGDIAGTVTDPSGAAVPNATITITSKATGASQVVTSNAQGSYHVPLLKPGDYTLVVKATGFEQASVSATVSASITNTADVKLSVGSAAQTVEVTAAAPILHTESADLSTTYSLEQVQSLPNPGNDLTFVAQTAPGSTMNTQGGYGNFSAFGLPATSNTFTINGGYLNDPFLNVNNSGATNLLLGNNDVSDVTVVSNAYNASFGGLGGDQINEISRSGANHFHGNAAYWWNGRIMNANDFFNNQTGTPRNFDNVNQWAAAIGGPIKRDKSFFFFNYEGLRLILPTSDNVFAPSASYEAQTLANLAATGHSDEIAGYQNIFSLYNNAPGYANAIPSPTSDPAPYTTVQFRGHAANFTHEWLMTGRVDQVLGDKDHLFGHFEIDKGLQATYTSLLNPIFNADSPQPQYSGQLNETHIFSPALTNQFLFAAIYYRAIFTNTNLAAANKLVPFSLIFADGDLGSNGGGAFPGGEDFLWPQGRNVTGYQFTDDVNWNRGNHNIQFGWTIRRNDVTDYGPSVLTTPETEAFNTNPLNPDGTPALPSPYAFQNGQVDFWATTFPQRPTQPVALYAMGWYGQDQWKVTPKFTFTYGLRMEHDSNPVCVTNCFARLSTNFFSSNPSPDTPYSQLILSGQHQAFNSLQTIGWEPRVGFAFTPDEKTTIRGGFGMFADSFPGQIADSLLNNAPTNVPFTIISQNSGNPNAPAAGYALIPTAAGSAGTVAVNSNAAFSAGFHNGATLNSLSAIPGFSPPNIVTPVKHIKYPTYEEWSLTVERQFTKTAALSLGYVGNHTYSQPIQAVNTNAFGFGGLPASQPNPNFGSANQIYSAGNSNYNGLVASVVNRARWLTLQFNYVYSHALDNVSNGGFNPFNGNSYPGTATLEFPTNPTNFSQNYGNSDYDTRNYISASYVIPLPYWRGPRALTDGWEFSGTAFHNTGYPFSVVSNTAGSGIPFYGALAYAQQVAPLKSNHCGGASHSIYGPPGTLGGTAVPCSFVSSFADPTALGQGRRNSIYGSGFTDTDFTVAKSFGIPHWESAHLKVGAQFFNLFNHPNFFQPNPNVDSPTFGTISSTVNTPTSILGSFLGGDASPRLIQFTGKFSF